MNSLAGFQRGGGLEYQFAIQQTLGADAKAREMLAWSWLGPPAVAMMPRLEGQSPADDGEEDAGGDGLEAVSEGVEEALTGVRVVVVDGEALVVASSVEEGIWLVVSSVDEGGGEGGICTSTGDEVGGISLVGTSLVELPPTVIVVCFVVVGCSAACSEVEVEDWTEVDEL